MLLKTSWILFLLTIKIFKDDINLSAIVRLSHIKLFYRSSSMSESQQGLAICDVISAKAKRC